VSGVEIEKRGESLELLYKYSKIPNVEKKAEQIFKAVQGVRKRNEGRFTRPFIFLFC